MEFNSCVEADGHNEKAFYDYNNVRMHSAISYMIPNEFYNKLMKEHGKEVEPSIIYPQK